MGDIPFGFHKQNQQSLFASKDIWLFDHQNIGNKVIYFVLSQEKHEKQQMI
jgi:hypothetical protein